MLLALFLPLARAWDADAGVVRSLTDGATVTANSNASDAARVLDGDDNTAWASEACFPTGFLSRTDLNPLLDQCAAGGCTLTGTADPSSATDASFYTGAAVALSSGAATMRVPLAAATTVDEVAFRGFGGPVDVYAETTAGEVLLGTYATTSAYTMIRYAAPAEPITAVVLRATSTFTATEVAAYAGPCTATVVVDLGVDAEIGVVRSRHWAGGSGLASSLQASRDGATWTTLAELDPDALGAVETHLGSPVVARYLAVRQEVSESDWTKVYLWELDAWDANGRHGPLPAARPAQVTYADLVGVNGIWGWGTGDWSDHAAPGTGPALYAEVATHARNYHNLNWDVTDPDHVPDYDHMSTEGTEAQGWLDWDREYGAWTAAGLTVDASIQFTDSSNPASSWNDPYAAAYGYARAFATHFGPTSGTGAIRSIEAGNEPWDYAASFYTEVLRGFVDGAAAGDPAMIVLPGALQASDPDSESENGGDYIGARVPEEVGTRLGAINLHSYSYLNDTTGERIAVWPEHAASSFRSVVDGLRWRDANLPATPVWLTEWGWDSDGAGEACNDGECVSEAAQAVYAVRGALIAGRLGLARATWFFYANIDGVETLYGRSGLTSSPSTDFQKKASFLALQGLRARVGDRVFVSAVEEDDDAWIYALGSPDGTVTHLVGWRPVDAADATTFTVTVDAPAATHAWTLAGLDPAGEAAPLPPHGADGLTLTLSATPLVIELGDGGDTGGDSAGDSDSAGPGDDSAAGDDSARGDTAQPNIPSGCGCSAAPSASTGALALLAVAVLARRRRSAPPA